MDEGKKGKEAVVLSMTNHFEVLLDATNDFDRSIELLSTLQEHIEYRLKQYTKCIAKSTPNYLKYLIETYNRQLTQMLRNSLDN
jgi:hypothetical protein